jgi:selenophosphate synthetase-related protein
MSELLSRVVDAYRHHAGVAQKAPIGLVSEVFGPSDWISGIGDDGAVIDAGGHQVVVGGEAMFPPFVEADPRGAGLAAILTNVNDLAAMGAEPLAIVDTVVGPRPIARAVLEGMREGSRMYDVPVVGGHLTIRDGPASVSAFGLGRVERPLSVRNVADGQVLMLACALEGTMRHDFPFFASFPNRRQLMAGDIRLFASLAAAGHAAAAKDVSMAGLVGSLAMLLEARRAGATVNLENVPVPDGVPMERWLSSFPAYAFLLCVDADRVDDCRTPFLERGLTCQPIGRIDDTGQLRLIDGDDSEVVVDFRTEHLTGITPI